MKKLYFLLFTLVLMSTATMAQQTNGSNGGKLLRHVVLFKFKEGSTPADIKKVEDAFRALPSKIRQIRNFEWGTNNSPEGLNNGFTHCFFVTFTSEKDREAYLPHPDHKAFVEVLSPYLEKALVVDYWAEK
ncbi:MAG TPA: Dabb family protein [Chitinophagaceae bacterium]|jgi:hypothetical protein|nr:Dabb family protein [Chitinophagaceae bacterium]